MLGALAVADPSSAANMLRAMMGKLTAAQQRLAGMKVPGKVRALQAVAHQSISRR